MLYFAYGSNLHLGQMSRRCPAARPVGVQHLKGWRLVFRGVLDIVEAPRCTVVGALYKITPQCERALDRYEGFPHLYQKRVFRLGDETGMFYVMNPSHTRYPIAPPSRCYYDVCAEGFRDWGLPVQRLYRARRHAELQGDASRKSA